MKRYAKVDLRLDQVERTPEGFLRATVPVTKTGVFPYKNEDGTIRFELRHPRQVFSKASIDSLKMKPVQVEHRAMLDSTNIDQFKVGHLGEDVEVDGNVLRVPIVIDGKSGLDAVAGGKKELSCGYELDIVPAPAGSTYDGVPYTHEQTNIRYNHLAIVDRGRLGSDLRLDKADAYEVDSDSQHTPPQERPMSLKKISLDGIEYDAAPEVINALSKANMATATEKARADAAETKVTAKDAQISTLTGERDAAKAEVVTSKAALDKMEKEIPQRAAQIAKDRAEVDNVARAVLGDSAFQVSVGMDIPALKREVVKSKHPSIKLDGKDDLYVNAVFDSVAASIATDGTEAAAANRGDSAPRPTAADGKKPTVEEARLASEKKRNDAWMKPLK